MNLSVARILDANANRAREAIRVMEDYARFVLDDGCLCGELKKMRHDLRGVLAMLPSGILEANRDTPGDVGTGVTTEMERERGSAEEVVTAAGKRLSEAMRSLEEYGKVIDGEFASRIEGLRYHGYELERRLQVRLGVGSIGSDEGNALHPAGWRLCVLITEEFCKRPWLEVLDGVIAGGADCVQLREKGLDDGKLLGRANVVARRCREAGIASIINDRVDVAMMVSATGVHVGQHDLPVGHIRRVAGRGLIVGVSTSHLVQAEAAVRGGADYVGIGPMFATKTKSKDLIAGVDFAREFLDKCSIPYLAIGGIDEENVGELVEAGVKRVAVCIAVCGADDPEGVTRRLRERIDGCSGAD